MTLYSRSRTSEPLDTLSTFMRLYACHGELLVNSY
eukprot:SAG11_NODE_35434_length_266_cov_1.329341_1_plen_34_part_10